jgi:hypothetical protein
LAERVFARKLERVGFADIRIDERHPFGIHEAAIFPLFTDEVVELMRRLIPPERHGSVATSVIVRARTPS